MSFKIIALEILDSCESEHSRNLIKGVPYIFYKNYKIKRENGNETIELVSDDFDLYSKDSETKINISAIVGKNGSGKSTLIELLIKGINNFFYTYSNRNKAPYNQFHSVEKVKKLFLNIFYKINNVIFKMFIYENNGIIGYNIFKYEYDQQLKSYTISNNNNIDEFDNYFYTEILNYSHYAYNSIIDGDWLKNLFHKNDGYQTPIVLSPYRRKGNIDINLENDLVFQRLLANLFRYDQNGILNLNLGDNLEAYSLKIEIKKSDYYKSKLKKLKIDLSLYDEREKVFDILFNKRTFSINKEILEIAKTYLFYKLISICNKYQEYRMGGFINTETNEITDLERLIQTIKADKSHITLKIRQTINYLLYNNIYYDQVNNELKIETLAENINEIKGHDNIINFLPPPIFNTDINLKSKKDNNKIIFFNTLSSGEKQLIYTTNSIYYHLSNIDSVHYSHVENKLKYKYVNIIFEEIELYFHPEFQRIFIKNLIEGIEKLQLNSISGINIIFVTHSPFILSDIPNSNIMYLHIDEKGKSNCLLNTKKSFASNIHHLLGDNFFFEDNIFIGEFAHKKIEEIINFIKMGKNESLIEYYYNLIMLIDEPIIKAKLFEMLFEKFKNFKELKEKETNEKLLKNYAQKLGIKIDITN